MFKHTQSGKSGCNPATSGCSSIVLIVLGIVMLIISNTIAKDTARSMGELLKADSITGTTKGIVKGTGELWAEKPVQVPYGGLCAAFNLTGKIYYSEKDGSSSTDTSSTPYDKCTLGENVTLKVGSESYQVYPRTELRIFGETRDQGDLPRVDEIPPMYPYDFSTAMLTARDGLSASDVFRYFKVDVTAIENGSTVFVLGNLDQSRLTARDTNRPLVMAITEADYKSFLEGQQIGSKIFFWIGIFVMLIGIGWLFIILVITVGIAAGGIWLLQKLLNRGQ